MGRRRRVVVLIKIALLISGLWIVFGPEQAERGNAALHQGKIAQLAVASPSCLRHTKKGPRLAPWPLINRFKYPHGDSNPLANRSRTT
jgi:hypothetical protein